MLRSQSSVVSRWFVIPIAVSSCARSPADASAASAAASTLDQISTGSCSTHPGCGYRAEISTYPRPRISSSSSTTRHVVPDVPWSIARINRSTRDPPTMASVPSSKRTQALPLPS